MTATAATTMTQRFFKMGVKKRASVQDALLFDLFAFLGEFFHLGIEDLLKFLFVVIQLEFGVL